jgi:alkylated DNA repair dioxygenase AlkB
MLRSSLKSAGVSRQLERQFDFGENNNWLPMPDAEVALFPEFFQLKESDQFFQKLFNQTNWRQEKIRVYGKSFDLPRLTAWYGDPGKAYSYSGISMQPDLWTETLLNIKKMVDGAAGVRFNSVLLSLYRTGQDSLSWHQDDEPELGENPVIASVSFGDTRAFQFRHKVKKELSTVSIELTHGSLLIMKGQTQRFWVHQVPKTSRRVAARINLTFRVIY